MFISRENDKKAGKWLGLAILIALVANTALIHSVNAQTRFWFKTDQEPVISQLASVAKVHSKEPKVVLMEADGPDKVVRAVITAYTSTPDQTDDSPFIAASGKRVYDGMIAANWLPFGTKIKIPSLYGDKLFTVDDRMNKRYGFGRMDIWLDVSKTEARKFGVKRVVVEIFYPEQKVAYTK